MECMRKITSLDDAVEALLSYSPAVLSWSFHLDEMRRLLEYLGNPQEKYRSIHIAGTSGKTSTAYFIRGMLEAAGYKTGLTVSPHIVAVNERVQIGGVSIEEKRFINYLNEFFALLSQAEFKPSYFALLVAFAFWVFERERVDYAVIETGLGGRLDATNTIHRPDKLCVLTNIGLDHTELLGDTLDKITAEKAGIIHEQNYVVARQQPGIVMNVFRARARDMDATLQEVSDMSAPAILPEFQHQNWAMAHAVYNYIAHRDGLPELTQEQYDAVAQQTPPGRGEVYYVHDKTIILDGAHNPQKIAALLHSLDLERADRVALLANFIESPDSKLKQVCELLAPIAGHIIIPEFRMGQDVKTRRSLQAIDTAREFLDHTTAEVETIPDPNTALRVSLERPETTLLITGSLYLVSLLRPEILKLQGK